MIEELTKEQKEKFSYYVAKWTKIGLSTEPINFEKAKEAVKKAYQLGGLEEPKNFIYCKSPLTAQIVINILQNFKISTTNYRLKIWL